MEGVLVENGEEEGVGRGKVLRRGGGMVLCGNGVVMGSGRIL